MRRPSMSLPCSLLLFVATLAECWWSASASGSGSSSSTQYHIQTDEGPERFFRFQTDNGQFRKEKRLQDGTVIGTEAWIDAAGFLRQKDYIADTKGYRILKSKTIFVGKDRHIEDAIKATKSVAGQAGILVDGRRGPGPPANNALPFIEPKRVYAKASIATRTDTGRTAVVAQPPPPPKFRYLSPAEAAKLPATVHLGYDHQPDELPPATLHYGAYGNALTEYGASPLTSSVAVPAAPALIIQPPFLDEPHDDNVNDNMNVNAADHLTGRQPAATDYYAAGSVRVPSPPASFQYRLASPPSQSRLRPPPPSPSPPLPPLPLTTSVQHNKLEPDAEAPEAADYDGVASTRNGFRYFLPRQYHEEEQIDGQHRAGSFGYVDPFGIRRVVYYSASPARGFVHRNNNNYVGLDAPPYDQVVRS